MGAQAGAAGSATWGADALDRALAAIALDELERRREIAARKVASGALTPGDANGLMLPWAALACRAGADVPDLAKRLAELRAIPGSRAGRFFTEAELRVTVADEICPLAQIRATLTDAREDALDRAERAQAAAGGSADQAADPALIARARGLCTLASAFGVPMQPSPAEPERIAA